MTTPTECYVEFLRTLSIDKLDMLSKHVTPDVRFSDPFNDVTGIDNMRQVFLEMFQQVGPINFTVLDARGDEEIGVLVWRYEAHLLKKPWIFEGTSVLKYSKDGRVSEHVDYWDAARNFYERLPIIGWLLCALRRRLAIQTQSR